MSVDGIACSVSTRCAAAASSPADTLSQLLLVLRQAQQAHRETERALTNAGVEAAEARARHASEKAEASRNSALLQLCINAGQTIGSISSDITVSRSADPQHTGRINANVHDEIGGLVVVASTADEAFGFAHDAEALDAEMVQDGAQQSRFDAYQDQARTIGDEIDDAVADVQQTLRDVVHGQEGGQ